MVFEVIYMAGRPRMVGRPPVNTGEKHVKISVSIPPELNLKLEDYCKEHGGSKSKVVALAVKDWLSWH